MKRQFKFLLFAVLMLTLVMMTMICVSAAADGDTEDTEGFDEANYNFKVSASEDGSDAARTKGRVFPVCKTAFRCFRQQPARLQAHTA